MTTKPARHIEERLISEAVPVKGGFLFLTWRNGSIGIVDLRDMLAELPVFEFLRDPDAFADVRVESDGTAVFWIDHDDDVVDVDSDTLWMRRKPLPQTPPGGRAPGRRAPHEMEPA